MTEYKNAQGITDEQITEALVKAAQEGDELRGEIYANPSLAGSNRVFLMLQARAEHEVIKLAPDASSEDRARMELTFIANSIKELQDILVEEMSEILAINKS